MSLYRQLCLAVLCIGGAVAQAAAPVNDAFTKRTVLVGTNLRLTASNVGATREPGEPLHVGDPGGASVWWSWTAPVAGLVMISTANSDFDSLLAVYTGSSISSLTLVAGNDDEDAAQVTSAVSFIAQAGTSYEIVVDGLFDEAPASGVIKLSLGMDTPPHIDAVTRTPNGSMLLSVSGPPDHTYALEISQNLFSWTELARRPNSTGKVEFLDDRAAQLQPVRFYRIRQVN